MSVKGKNRHFWESDEGGERQRSSFAERGSNGRAGHINIKRETSLREIGGEG